MNYGLTPEMSYMEADEMRRQSWARVPQISIDPTSMDGLADPEEVDR